MAKPQTLKATERARTGSGVLKRMRREGYIPCVIYGSGTESKNIKVDAKTFTDMLNHAASDSILVNLDIEGDDVQLAFLQDVQHNALTGQIMHVDFLAVDKKTSITASIPIELIGDSVGVASGGLLDQQLHSIEISCLPNDLPEHIEADVTNLDVGQAITVAEVSFPEGVVPAIEGDITVAIIAAPRVEEETEEEAEDAVTEPEVTSEAKSEENAEE